MTDPLKMCIYHFSIIDHKGVEPILTFAVKDVVNDVMCLMRMLEEGWVKPSMNNIQTPHRK